MKATKRHRNVWTQEEDKRLKYLVEEKKIQSWVLISNFFRNRSNKDCRDHYILTLSPCVSKRKWTEEEEKLLLEKYKEYGPKWVKLTSFFDKRSSNDLKNRVKLINKRKKPLRKRVINIEANNSNSNQSDIPDATHYFNFFQDIEEKDQYNDDILDFSEFEDYPKIFNFETQNLEKNNSSDIYSSNNL